MAHPVDVIYSRLLSGLLSSSLQMVQMQPQGAFNNFVAGVGELSSHLFQFCICPLKQILYRNKPTIMLFYHFGHQRSSSHLISDLFPIYVISYFVLIMHLHT